MRHDDEFDDRCLDEGREADIDDARRDGNMSSYGVPYDPYGDDCDEEEDGSDD